MEMGGHAFAGFHVQWRKGQLDGNTEGFCDCVGLFFLADVL
jgi:hypothetical protein